jgi:hypothetical protein
VFIDYLNKMYLGIYDGGAISSYNGEDKMIILPITQMQLMLSMAIAEIFLLSDPNYTVRIGSENYFSLAVGGFIAGLFIFALIAFRFGSKIKFKDVVHKERVAPKIIHVRQSRQGTAL